VRRAGYKLRIPGSTDQVPLGRQREAIDALRVRRRRRTAD
jgi:hypothetical protein